MQNVIVVTEQEQQQDIQVQPVERDPWEGVVAGWLHENTKSEKTHTAYQDTIVRFGEALRQNGLTLGSSPSLVAAVAQAWVRERIDGRTGTRTDDASPATQNMRLAILSSLYRYANRRTDGNGDTVPNPITKVKRQKVQAYRGAHAISAKVVRERLAAIDRTTLLGMRDYCLLRLALQTGRRATEMLLLSWRHLHIDSDTVRIDWPENKGKAMSDRLPAGVAEVLLAWLHTFYGDDLSQLSPDAPVAVSLARDPKLRGRRMTRQALSAVWEHRLGTSKIHATRHTFALLMDEDRARTTEIQARLGHSNIATTGRYLAALNRDVNPHADAIERMITALM